jgi:hypothetical protein
LRPRVREAVLAAQLLHRNTGIGLLREADVLLFAEPLQGGRGFTIEVALPETLWKFYGDTFSLDVVQEVRI